MPDSYVAVDTAMDLRARARDLRRWWESAFSGDPVRGKVRPVVAHSWSRMTGAGLDPEHLRPRPALDDDALEAARAASPLRHAMAALRHHLGGIAQEAEHVMVVTDGAGRILWLEGHPRVLETARGITFTPGMLWTEGSAGTNAIGTALAIDHPVQIFSAEHFLPEQHPWWCSAAPLHDPATGEVLGVVDVSGPQRTAHPYSLTVVTAAARIAEAVIDQRRRADQAAAAAAPERRLWPAPAARAERPSAAAGPGLALRVLGRHGHTLQVDGGAPHEIGLRFAEVLALLVLHPDGLSADQLTLHLYGEQGKPVSTRALLSRLRTLLDGRLEARPYRLVGPVDADFSAVASLLAAGDVGAALARYRGPLLVESEVPRIIEARDELAMSLRRAALSGSPDDLWRWLGTEHGREDPEAMEVFLELASAADPRRDATTARLRALARRWELDAV
jgi:hypothetical protein